MLGLRKLRFVDIGTGLSMMLGTAGMLAAGVLSAAEPQCSTATGCTSAQPACCDHIFDDAAARLKGLYAGLNCDTCVAPATPAPVCGAAAPGCGTAAGGCAATGGGCGSDPFALMDLFTDDCGNNHLKDKGWKIGGSLAQSYTMNFNNPNNRYNGPVTWTDRSNEYELNQFWLYAEKATDTSNKDWDFGGRFDILYGTNARLTTASGLETPNLDSNGGLYGLALPQFYVEGAYKKLKVKVGHFLSPVGYFTVDTTQNFFSSLPYTYQWGEPFTHTGALATYTVSDQLTVSSGMIQGWDNFDSHNPHMGYIGGYSYNFQDKSNLTQMIFLTQEPNFNAQFTQRYYQSVVYTKPINDDWTYVGQTDFGTQRDATINGRRANWYGLNQYVFRKFNDHWTWGANFEWWRDEEGFRVAGFLPGAAPSGITGNMAGVPVATLPGGYTGDFFQTTVGPRWYPTGKPNFFVRPNFRFDWYTGGTDLAVNPNGFLPYGDGNKSNQALFITDVCITF